MSRSFLQNTNLNEIVMNVESCKLGKVTIEALTHQEPCMLIGQRFTLCLVEQDPCRFQLSLNNTMMYFTK